MNPKSGRLVVRGKGNKERTAWLVQAARRVLWLTGWLCVVTDPGALFVAINKSGRIVNHEHMTPKTIYTMLAKRATEAGVSEVSRSIH
jgi:site-specific recombinase XerC